MLPQLRSAMRTWGSSTGRSKIRGIGVQSAFAPRAQGQVGPGIVAHQVVPHDLDR